MYPDQEPDPLNSHVHPAEADRHSLFTCLYWYEMTGRKDIRSAISGIKR